MSARKKFKVTTNIKEQQFEFRGKSSGTVGYVVSFKNKSITTEEAWEKVERAEKREYQRRQLKGLSGPQTANIRRP